MLGLMNKAMIPGTTGGHIMSIPIANSDSVGGSSMQAAVGQAWRAVKELG